MLGRLKKLLKMSAVERKYLFRKKYMPNHISSTLMTSYLKEKGVEIGKGTVFHDPPNTSVGTQRGWMIHIGEYCKITGGVKILDHDYSRSVLRRRYNDIVGEAGVTRIGDNVFIGVNSIILMGTTIGNNCVVGAGSIVSGTFPDDVVIAGNPARIIMPLEKYYEKRKAACIESGKLYCREFFKKYGRAPKPSEMTAFFPLFLERSEQAITDNNIWIGWNGDEKQEILESFLQSTGPYKNYDMFLEDALQGLR